MKRNPIKLEPVPGTPDDPVFTSKEAASYLRLASLAALYSINQRGEISYYRLGKRRLRYRKSDLDRYLNRNPVTRLSAVFRLPNGRNGGRHAP